MFVIDVGAAHSLLIVVANGRAEVVGYVVDEVMAERIRDLLNRHGMVDTPIDEQEFS